MTNTITIYQVITGTGSKRTGVKEFTSAQKASDYQMKMIRAGRRAGIIKAVINTTTREMEKTRIY